MAYLSGDFEKICPRLLSLLIRRGYLNVIVNRGMKRAV